MKEARRAEAKARRESAPAKPADHDPDLDGIVAGPQDPPEWQREFFEEEQRAKEAAELEAKNRQ